MDAIAERLQLDAGTLWILIGAAVCLLAGTVIRGMMLWRRPDPRARARWRSLGTWWALFALLVVMLALGRPAVVLAMAVASLLGLRESLALTAARRPRSWLASVRVAGMAVLVAVAGPAFAVAVASLPAPVTRPDARLGWLVLLLVLTELDDIAQAWWGRALGSHRMAPVLSPNKTWEGLAGGVVTTMLAALLLAPLVTDYGRAVPLGGDAPGPPWLWALVVGLVVSVAGTAGDLTASHLKRTAGVKDSGSLLPGQGGVLDRIDSLSLAAPAYFALTWTLWAGPA